MIISILSVDQKYGIGKKNGLLFSLPKDMAFFRQTTTGHVVAMGENTLLSFPGQKPLRNRVNIVLSKDLDHNYEGCVNIHDFQEFLRLIKKESLTQDVYIIGGASIYNQTIEYVDKVLLTKVDADGEAEVFFHNLDEDKNFECVDEGEVIQDGDYRIRFTTYVNNNKKEIL